MAKKPAARPARMSHTERKAHETKMALRDKLARAARYPRGQCWISRGWVEAGIASVTISRRRVDDGSLVAVMFLVDLGCLGVKDVALHNNARPATVTELVESAPDGAEPIPFDDAARLIETAVAWAAHCGFAPVPEFEFARLIYADADPNASTLEVECGKNGRPFYSSGPNDDVGLIVGVLEERFGPDGFELVHIEVG